MKGRLHSSRPMLKPFSVVDFGDHRLRGFWSNFPLSHWLSSSPLQHSRTAIQKFIRIGLGVSVLRMRDFAPLGTKWLGYFWVLEKGYSRDARTDFDENMLNDVVPRKEVPFGGRETKI